jgi:hypothetical protein
LVPYVSFRQQSENYGLTTSSVSDYQYSERKSTRIFAQVPSKVVPQPYSPECFEEEEPKPKPKPKPKPASKRRETKANRAPQAASPSTEHNRSKACQDEQATSIAGLDAMDISLAIQQPRGYFDGGSLLFSHGQPPLPHAGDFGATSPSSSTTASTAPHIPSTSADSGSSVTTYASSSKPRSRKAATRDRPARSAGQRVVKKTAKILQSDSDSEYSGPPFFVSLTVYLRSHFRHPRRCAKAEEDEESFWAPSLFPDRSRTRVAGRYGPCIRNDKQQRFKHSPKRDYGRPPRSK